MENNNKKKEAKEMLCNNTLNRGHKEKKFRSLNSQNFFAISEKREKFVCLFLVRTNINSYLKFQFCLKNIFELYKQIYSKTQQTREQILLSARPIHDEKENLFSTPISTLKANFFVLLIFRFFYFVVPTWN